MKIYYENIITLHIMKINVCYCTGNDRGSTYFRQTATGITSTVLPNVTKFAVKSVSERPAISTSLGIPAINGDSSLCRGLYTALS